MLGQSCRRSLTGVGSCPRKRPRGNVGWTAQAKQKGKLPRQRQHPTPHWLISFSENDWGCGAATKKCAHTSQHEKTLWQIHKKVFWTSISNVHTLESTKVNSQFACVYLLCMFIYIYMRMSIACMYLCDMCVCVFLCARIGACVCVHGYQASRWPASASTRQRSPWLTLVLGFRIVLKAWHLALERALRVTCWETGHLVSSLDRPHHPGSLFHRQRRWVDAPLAFHMFEVKSTVSDDPKSDSVGPSSGLCLSLASTSRSCGRQIHWLCLNRSTRTHSLELSKRHQNTPAPSIGWALYLLTCTVLGDWPRLSYSFPGNANEKASQEPWGSAITALERWIAWPFISR